jgi:hypothetical protein
VGPGHALNSHHHDTLQKIFVQPTSGNVGWRHVLHLLETVGTVVTQPNGKLRVTLGTETEVITPPRHKDVDTHVLLDLGASCPRRDSALMSRPWVRERSSSRMRPGPRPRRPSPAAPPSVSSHP